MTPLKAELTEEGVVWRLGLFKPPRPQSCWVCQFARWLLRTGEDPDRVVRVHRKGVPAFLDRTVSVWAGATTHESDSTSIKFAKYKEFKGIE